SSSEPPPALSFFAFYLVISRLCLIFFFLLIRPPPISTLFPYTTLFRSNDRSSFSHASIAIVSVFKLGLRVSMILAESIIVGFQRSEEHTSELQSLTNLVCRLLLEKKKKNQ